MNNTYPPSTMPVKFVTDDGTIHNGFFLKHANKYVRNVNRWKDTDSGTWFDDEAVTEWW